MKSLFFLAAASLVSHIAASQVAKNVIVEHFTNSKCSICANRNPGFFTNLNNNPAVLHIAYYPSAPYSTCYFSMQNPDENDARTNFYGIYGSTPRLVINGDVVPANANYSSATLFNPYSGQTTPIELKISLFRSHPDSVKLRVVLLAHISNFVGEARLYGALAEDVVNYTGSNGETTHYNVMRKAVWGDEGITVSVPALGGDSLVLEKTVASQSAWAEEHLSGIAILQSLSDKAVIQASRQPDFSDNNTQTAIINTKKNEIKLYPNPVINGKLQVESPIETQAYILDAKGMEVLRFQLMPNTNSIDIEMLPIGVYQLAGKELAPKSFIKSKN